MVSLTHKQQALLDFIKTNLRQGRPFPSLSDIGAHFGFSRNTAKFHLNALKKKGLIKRRAQRVSPFLLSHKPVDPALFELVARVPAGTPDVVEDETERFICFNQDYFGKGSLKAVVVSGDSMLGDAICDGDIAIVQLKKTAGKRDIVAVQVAGEGVTVKRLRLKKKTVDLVPSNPDYPVKTFPADQVEIVGKVVGVVRKT